VVSSAIIEYCYFPVIPCRRVGTSRGISDAVWVAAQVWQSQLVAVLLLALLNFRRFLELSQVQPYL
jgi:hypothetical protein